MGTTIGVSATTRDKLAKIKRELGAASIDDALHTMIEERAELRQRRHSDELLASVARHRGEIQAFCQVHHIRRLSIFGSALRGDARPDSDIDLLVEFDEGRTPGWLAFERLQMDLAEMLGTPIDLNTAGFLHPRFRDAVRAEAQVIHAA